MQDELMSAEPHLSDYDFGNNKDAQSRGESLKSKRRSKNDRKLVGFGSFGNQQSLYNNTIQNINKLN